MPVRFPCPTCNSPLQAPDAAVGKVIKCKECEERVRVPARKSRKKARKRARAASNGPDDEGFLDGVDLGATDERFKVCQRCKKQFNAEEEDEDGEITEIEICPYCGYDHGTGDYTVTARRKRLKKKGQLDPSEFYEHSRKESLTFAQKHWMLCLRSGLYFSIPFTLYVASLFMCAWVSMEPPKYFWGFVAFVCGTVPPGWVWFLHTLCINATIDEKAKLKRVNFSFFDSAANGINLGIIHIAYIVPVITAMIGAYLISQEQYLAGFLVGNLGGLIILPLYPVMFAHMAMPVTWPGWLVWKTFAGFSKCAGACFYWLGFALLTYLPAIIGFVIVGAVFGGDIETFVNEVRENSQYGYELEMSERGEAQAPDAADLNKLDFNPLIAPAIITFLSVYYIGFVALYPARMNGWLVLYNRRDLELIEREKEVKYVARERKVDESGNVTVDRGGPPGWVIQLGGTVAFYVIANVILAIIYQGDPPFLLMPRPIARVLNLISSD